VIDLAESSTRPSSPGSIPGSKRIFGALAARAIANLDSVSRVTVTALLAFMFPDWYGPYKKYQPEQHYMRGPGPKWKAKQGL